MRIACLSGDPGIPVFGDKGAAVHLRELATAFTRRGHDVVVVASRLGQPAHSTTWRRLEVPPAEVTALDADAEWRASRANARVRATLDRLHAEWPIDLVYERYSLWQYAGLSFARRAGLSYVLEVNSPLRMEQARWRSLGLAGRAARVERLLFTRATRIVAVSQEVAGYTIRQGAPASRVRVVPNGVDLGPFRDMSPRRPSDAFTVGFVGSLKPWHGVDTLLDAAARLAPARPDLHVLIVGDGPERGALEARAASGVLRDRVTFTGAVPKTDVPAWLARMDVATAPYPRLDGFYFSPLKIYDYMAAGRAIVASRIGQIADVLTDGVDALLAVPGDASDLSRRIGDLHDDPAGRARLGAAARSAAFARHGWEQRVDDILGPFHATPAPAGGVA